jgi:Secretion system C-terminal sorting domain
VLNRPLTIQDVRYSSYGNIRSGYNGYKVKISGVVISDTSDIPGNHALNPPRVYIQNGNTQWSGILLGTYGSAGTQVAKLYRGDSVTVEGIVATYPNNYGTTRIDTLDLLTVNSQGNILPEPHIMKTGDVGTLVYENLSAEKWNGCLVTYNNVTIDSANADSLGNYGESFGTDYFGGTHTRLVWSDGNTSLNAGPYAVKVKKGDYFYSITGVLGLAHSNYKLCPRKDGDIIGFLDYIKNESEVTPAEYKLDQNFPNPFNPSTTISYSLPKSGLVTVKILNVLGQEVRTLVGGIQAAGLHHESFDANSMTSGVYFYSLTADNFTQIKKMILLK